MSKFKDTNLSNLTVYGATVGACLDLSAFCVDLFAYLGSAQVVEKWSPQLFQKLSSFRFFQQNSATILVQHEQGVVYLQI